MIVLPDDPSSAIALADWIEASLIGLAEEPYRISDAEIVGALTDAGLDAVDHREQLAAEIRRRSMILGDRYPIERDGEGFGRIDDIGERAPYSFMLLVSLNQHYAKLVHAGAASTPARLFEQLTGEALKTYVGGEVVRLGAARVDPVPAALPAAVRYLGAEMREQETYGQLEIHDAGDDGCDLVAWRPFPDGQPSQLIVLAQCAIGTDWAAKRSELDLDAWSKHLNWHAKPTKAFAVPFVHEAGNSWRETSARGGVVLDRLRIASLVDPDGVAEGLGQAIRNWLPTAVGRLADVAMV